MSSPIPPIISVDDHVVEPPDLWHGESGGRLIPLCLIPLWDPVLAAAEVRRNAARGVRAVASLPPDEVWKIIRGNAIEMLGLPAVLPST